jgi:hypothetical protein
MAKLIWVQLETCHANRDGTAWYAYFEGEPTEAELEVGAVFADRDLVEEAPLGWDDEDEYNVPEEVPNPLAEYAGLRRYYVAGAC